MNPNLSTDYSDHPTSMPPTSAWMSPRVLGAVIWIDDEGYISRANGAAIELLDCSSERDIVGIYYRNFFKVLHLEQEPEGSPLESDAVIHSLIEEGSALGIFGFVKTRTGELHPYEGVMIMTYDRDLDASGTALAIQSADF